MTTQRTLLALVGGALFLTLGLSGCEKKQEAAAPEHTAAKKASPQAAKAAPAGAKVEVAAKGTNFDPPVEIASLPAGAWYCDMGKSHYARMEKGDATCPRCKMKLHHKAAK